MRALQRRRLAAMVTLTSAAGSLLVAGACGGKLEPSDSAPEHAVDGRPDVPIEASQGGSRGFGRDAGDADASTDARTVEIGPPPTGSLADGQCTHPTGHATFFDPDCVYIVGAFAEGGPGFGALFEPAHPEDHRGGTLAGLVNGIIRPTDNRLLYSGAGKGVRLVVPDRLVEGIPPHYPWDSVENDPTIATPACPGESVLWGIFPDDGVVIYFCSGQGFFLEGSAVRLPALEDGWSALGPGRIAIIVRPVGSLSPSRIWKKDGADVPITGLPVLGLEGGNRLVTARYVGNDTFVLAISMDAGRELERWTVTSVGVVSFSGRYLNPERIPLGGGVLDSRGNMYVLARSAISHHGRVLRFSTSGPPEIVYDEETEDGSKKLLRLHGEAHLFTGP
jgi:hypothetical protein